MNGFQILVLIVVSLAMIVSIGASMRGWVTRRESLIWSLVCLAAAVATVWPDLTRRLANAVGIGRGADLVFYCAVVLMLIGFWMTYIRLQGLRRQLTLLVRQLAIQEGERQYPSDKGEHS